MRNRPRTAIYLLLGVLVTLASSAAQVINRVRRSSRTPQQQGQKPGQLPIPGMDLRNTPLLQLDPATLLNDTLPEGFRGVKRNLDVFQAFPNYPPNWPVPKGWPSAGGLPSPYRVGANGQPIEVGSLPRALPPSPDAWPSWFDSRARGGESAFGVNLALLVRSSDRVWYKAVGEAAFVPLAFYDKGRVIRAGSEVHVRQRGSYEIHFHGGGYARARGPTALRVGDLSEAVNVLVLSNYDKVWLVTRLQPLRVILPDGSTLDMEGNSLVYLSSEDGVGVLLHSGEGKVHLSTAVGSITIPKAHRVKVFLESGGPAPLAIELQLDSGLRAQREGRVLHVDGGESGGTVLWGGIRVALQPGQELRVDPLAGAEFPEYTQKSNERK